MMNEGDQVLATLAIRGMIRGEVSAGAAELIDGELALDRAGTLVATRAGHDQAIALLRLEPGGEAEIALRPLYERFLLLNRSLREICTDWQTRSDGTANDHQDAAYDASVRDRLEDVQERAIPLLRRMSAVVESLEQYGEGLTDALDALDGGDTSMLTAPLAASYHTVWMWWHQELLLRLGIDRAEDERLEEEFVSRQGT
jgi:hypothetical protein